MKLVRKLRVFRGRFGDLPESLPEIAHEGETPGLLRTVGWVSAGAGVLALGLMLGRELRQRYKFTRRTPYDVYSHSGDNIPDVEFGVGI